MESVKEGNKMVVRVVARILDKLISSNVQINLNDVTKKNVFLRFQSSYAPDITIESYLDRLRVYSRCSDACFIMALIYIDKMIESKNLLLTNLNVHRILVTSLMLAAKIHDDLFYNNAYYAKLGGVTLSELNQLEVELLHVLDFALFINEDHFSRYSVQLKNYAIQLNISLSPPKPLFSTNQLYLCSTIETVRIPSPNNPHQRGNRLAERFVPELFVTQQHQSVFPVQLQAPMPNEQFSGFIPYHSSQHQVLNQQQGWFPTNGNLPTFSTADGSNLHPFKTNVDWNAGMSQQPPPPAMPIGAQQNNQVHTVSLPHMMVEQYPPQLHQYHPPPVQHYHNFDQYCGMNGQPVQSSVDYSWMSNNSGGNRDGHYNYGFGLAPNTKFVHQPYGHNPHFIGYDNVSNVNGPTQPSHPSDFEMAYSQPPKHRHSEVFPQYHLSTGQPSLPYPGNFFHHNHRSAAVI